jgi:hypothetical protein
MMKFFVVWFLVSIPVSLFIGRFFAAGSGEFSRTPPPPTRDKRASSA